jgi:preprotein translocase subunit SecD
MSRLAYATPPKHPQSGMGVTSSAGKPLQLRLVISSTEGTCSAPAVTSDSPAGACDNASATTHELAKALGTITAISVALPKDQGAAHSVTLELNKADAGTLDEVSREAVDKHLAIVLDGGVLSAPLVNEPLTTNMLTLAFGTQPRPG